MITPSIYEDTRWYTQKRRLTGFALACGAIERAESSDGEIRKVLEEQHGVYHVKALLENRRTWETFRSLPQARKAYDRIDINVCS